MKVIGVSNFDNESVSDILVEEHLESTQASKLAMRKNEEGGMYSTYFYQAVEETYKLYKFEP